MSTTRYLVLVGSDARRVSLIVLGCVDVQGFMNVTTNKKFEFAPNQGYDTIAHRYPMVWPMPCIAPHPSQWMNLS